MSSSDVTRGGLEGAAPDRDARIGALSGSGRDGRGGPDGSGRRDGAGSGGSGRGGGIDSMVGRADPRSYYGMAVLNRPTWAALDIAGYLFLGGLAGASSTLAAAAELTGRPGLARPLRAGAAVAISASLAALVHDLGRPSRFYNMLRVFKPTSPMSVGTWLLSAYAPAALGAAAFDRAVRLPVPAAARRPIGTALGLAAAGLGPAVATYTAVLVSDTAVPGWHEGHREMPFLFAGSAAAAAGGLGVATAPLGQSGPARRLAVAGAAAELVVGTVMRRRMGLAGEAYDIARAGRLNRAAEICSAAGAVLAVAGRRSRPVSALAGGALLAGSALTRFAVFHAGVATAEDPRYTIQPQRERLDHSG